jgi:hypothetical protein
MSNHISDDSDCVPSRSLQDLSSANEPTLRILLYTDDPDVADETTGWSLSRMTAHIKARPPAFAKLCIDLINRNSGTEQRADNKLYPELISKYHQIWFFGTHQINRKNFSLGVLRGGPDSELDDEEVAALRNWMKIGSEKGRNGGGVLMTGDHANEPPDDAIPFEDDPSPDTPSDHEHFLGLGRALGHRVPRAGRLRKWKGPPTRFKEDSFNSQVLTTGTDPDSIGLHSDPVPQQLILRTFNSLGEPLQNGQPHPLFLYMPDRWIQVFPDHAHEGSVVIPRKLGERTWPKGKHIQPKPRVVAHGVDKRNARILNIVAAYNGDSAGVGRIVADSTWHHYFNVNLNLFRPPGEEDSPADQIGQFYANLAIWLSPYNIRSEMTSAMIHFLAHDPTIFEVAGPPVQNPSSEEKMLEALTIGRLAFALLSELASPCEIHELLQTLIYKPDSAKYETVYLPDSASTLTYLPSKELLLGYAVSRYRRKVAIIESSGNEFDAQDQMRDVLDDSFKEAVELQDKLLSLTTTQILNFKSNY